MSAMPEREPNPPEYWDERDDDYECPRCGGEGSFLESEGDPSDWGEDTYCGPEDAVMICPDCRGRGYFRPPAARTTPPA